MFENSSSLIFTLWIWIQIRIQMDLDLDLDPDPHFTVMYWDPKHCHTSILVYLGGSKVQYTGTNCQ